MEENHSKSNSLSLAHQGVGEFRNRLYNTWKEAAPCRCHGMKSSRTPSRSRSAGRRRTTRKRRRRALKHSCAVPHDHRQGNSAKKPQFGRKHPSPREAAISCAAPHFFQVRSRIQQSSLSKPLCFLVVLSGICFSFWKNFPGLNSTAFTFPYKILPPRPQWSLRWEFTS